MYTSMIAECRPFICCILTFAEILDYGYPQNLDSGILKTYITQQGVRTQVIMAYERPFL